MFNIATSNVLGREGLDSILYGDGRRDTPQVVEAIELMFREFVESGYYPNSPNALTYDGANALFCSGEAAINPGLEVPELFKQVLDDLSEFPQAEASAIT
jgi:raffinose/stachyose/melibiose transport system substrate-binding protein